MAAAAAAVSDRVVFAVHLHDGGDRRAVSCFLEPWIGNGKILLGVRLQRRRHFCSGNKKKRYFIGKGEVVFSGFSSFSTLLLVFKSFFRRQ